MMWMPAARATPETDALTILTEAAADKNPAKRRQAISALEHSGAHPKAVALAEAALEDTELDVRQAAATALGLMKSRASIPKLRKAIDDEAPEVQFAAASALWALGDRSGRALFVEALAGERTDSSGMLKGSMRDAKRKLRNPAALAVMGAKSGMGILLGPFGMGVPVFEELLKDGGASARTLAAATLARDTDPSTIASLETALSDKNWIVRSAAAKALADRGSRRSLSEIATLLKDEKEGARYIAAASILRLSRGASR